MFQVRNELDFVASLATRYHSEMVPTGAARSHPMGGLSCWLLSCGDPMRGIMTILARGVGVSKADHMMPFGLVLSSHENTPWQYFGLKSPKAFLRESPKNLHSSGKMAGIEVGH